uniref:Transmembrane protein n=1 Tax=Fagus sylvatica TaxID=28930 RepID=A0A2N9HKG3_FAGSY
MEVLGLWSKSHEAHGLAMVVGLNRGFCRGWWVFGRGGGCLAMGLVIVGLWWKGYVCCDCEACRVWVVPWVIVWCL